MGLVVLGGIVVLLAIHLAPSSSTTFTEETFVPPKCLNLPEVIPKRYLSFNGTNQVIKLGVSDRLTHRLATQVFYIFLKEALGYPNVSIVKYSPKFDIDEIFSVFSESNNRTTWAPEYMINLEVWIPPVTNTIHITETHSVKECGNIAPPGRFGWFVPSRLIERNSNYWTNFKSPDFTRKFSLSEFKAIVSKYKNPKEKEFTPTWCVGLKSPCADLLAEKSSGLSIGLVQEITQLKLYVRVIWIKENMLERLVIDLKGTNHPVVFVGYSPSLLTLKEDFTSIDFPPCDPFSSEAFCSYVQHRLVKLAWSMLRGSAKPAFDSLQKMEFSGTDYNEMLLSYNRLYTEPKDEDALVYNVACEWMRNHSNNTGAENFTAWDSWTPKDEERNALNIGGIFPLSPSLFNAQGTALAAMKAIEAVNNSPTILRDYKLKFLLEDGQCKKDIVMKNFIEYILEDNYKKLVGILGPACSDTVEPLAGITRHFGTVVISYSAEGSSFSNRDKYPYFFRTIAENKQYQYVYLSLFKALGWKRVASITEDGTKYPEYISHTQALLRANDISFVDNRKYPPDWTRETMRKAAEEIKKNDARIVIADVDIEAARVLMCDAYHMKMTAKEGYVWFLPYWIHPNWYNATDVSAPNRASECNTSQLVEAANGHFSLAHMFFAPDDTVMQEGITVGAWRRNMTVHSDYAGYAYDAIWVFAYALDQLIKENESYLSDIHSNTSTTRFVELIKKTNFTGVSGHIYFGEGGSRTSPVNLIQLINGRKNIVGTFYPNTSDKLNGGRFEMGSPLWLNPGGAVPWDGTPPEQRCAIEALANFLNVDCHVAFIVANIFGFLLLMVILFIAFLFIKDRYDKKVKLTQKYMKSLGIDLNATSVGSLDKWEIQRDRVVINRKLGEGAFGMVYGGEALFDDKGWVAVAVKTLKVGSSTSEKLDFLSEAEVMKRFEHKNIVKLLGVCTQNEPVYTIMEFMLYGDLKTYLLARRDLVNERLPEESDEISSKKLTSMALDVARALGYLAELKYVHRDVASRNCLVNASRVVKLGDFGMTRPMFDNDYYRFARKGMLPVRWMAPESLALGVFTPASDVWSYGVLLYEIITFGSFPFQGMSNNQVLEHVKAGNTLNIPLGVKPQLANLIQSCWNRESKSRIKASAIVEILADNPRLLSPTLDAPLSSVQLEDTGQLEMQMSDKSRKFSLSLKQRIPSSPTQLLTSGLTTPTESRSIWSEPTAAGEPLLSSPTNHFPRNNSEEDYSMSQTDSIL